jgi:hypothetical protein
MQCNLISDGRNWHLCTFLSKVCSSVLLLRGSTVLERTLAALHTGVVTLLFVQLVDLLWTSYQPVAKASTYKGQHKKMHASSGIQTHDLCVQAIEAYASDRAATGSGTQWFNHRLGPVGLVAIPEIRVKHTCGQHCWECWQPQICQDCVTVCLVIKVSRMKEYSGERNVVKRRCVTKFKKPLWEQWKFMKIYAISSMNTIYEIQFYEAYYHLNNRHNNHRRCRHYHQCRRIKVSASRKRSQK